MKKSEEKKMCPEHPEQEAVWQCDSCQNIFCDTCITLRHYGRESLETCGLCGGRCRFFGQARVRDEKKKSFFSKLPGAFIYPFKGEGKIMLLIGVIFYEILRILSLAPFVGGIIGFIGLAYFAAYMLKILTASITGKEWMPELPDLTDYYNEIISPYLSVIIVTFVSFAPAVLFLVLSLAAYPTHGRERVSLKSRLQQISEFKNISCKDHKVKKARSGIKPGSRIVKYSKKYAASGKIARKTIEKKKKQLSRSRFYYGLTLFFLVGGLLYYPMALTTVGMESYLFLNPFIIIRSIIRVFLPYSVACCIFALVIAVNFLQCPLDWAGLYVARSGYYVLGFLVVVVQGFLYFYITAVLMRVLGLMHLTNKRRLGWT